MSDSPMSVDMLNAARNAQWEADAFLGYGSVKAVAPAKVNLFLSVGDKLPDGRHQVTTVMHSVTLHDTLYLHGEAVEDVMMPGAELSAGQALGGPCDNLLLSIDAVDKGAAMALDIPAEENIIFKALDAYCRLVAFDQPYRVAIRLEKAIPHQAGLGGGSSDAAAALLAFARTLGHDPARPELLEAAQAVGSDVAFFFQGGCALMEGAGEQLAHSLVPAKRPVLLVKPPVGVSTAAAYEAFDREGCAVDPALVAQAQEATAANEVPLVNNLAPAAQAVTPELEDVQQWLASQDAVETTLLCGSGSCFAAFTRSFDDAVALAAEAGKRGWWSRATSLSALRAALL